MTPLRIDITLKRPVERPHRPIHLDALIAKLIYDRLPPLSDQATIDAAFEAMPLDRRSLGGDPVWTASTIAFDWESQPMQTFGTRAIRAQEIHTIQQKVGGWKGFGADSKIDTAKGPFKSAVWAHESQHARRAIAYCIGDKPKLAELLADLDVIGARRRFRGGEVTGITITEDQRATDLWKRRYLPYETGIGIPTEGAYRLPLHDRRNQTLVRDNHLTYDHEHDAV